MRRLVLHQRRDANDINTRADLASYDPALYAIIDHVFGGVPMPATRSWTVRRVR